MMSIPCSIILSTTFWIQWQSYRYFSTSSVSTFPIREMINFKAKVELPNKLHIVNRLVLMLSKWTTHFFIICKKRTSRNHRFRQTSLEKVGNSIRSNNQISSYIQWPFAFGRLQKFRNQKNNLQDEFILPGYAYYYYAGIFIIHYIKHK